MHNACVKEGIKGKRLTKVTFLLQLTQFLSIKDFKRFPMFLMCGSEIFVKPQGRDFDFPSAHFRSSYFLFSQAVESFAWNIRVLKGQAELLLNAKSECQEYLRQVT